MSSPCDREREPHVLVLPSEEYLPSPTFLAGIFQRHQIEALQAVRNLRLGVLSVRLDYSTPMYVRALCARASGRPITGELGRRPMATLLSELADHILQPQKFTQLDATFEYPVVRAVGLRLTPTSPNYDYKWWLRAGLKAYERYEARFGRPDFVHAHNALNAGLLARAIKSRTGIPYILTEHSSAYHHGGIPERLKGRVVRAIACAEAAYVVSDALRSSMKASLGAALDPSTSMELLPNVLPRMFEEGEELATCPTTGAFIFLAVASHLSIKGLDVLLRSFDRLRHSIPDARLRLVGDGPLRRDLEHLAVDLGILDRVAFLGVLSPSEVRREMLKSHALVVSSRYETFGVVAIEALSCGLPVIATRCGGVEEIVTEEDGMLVPANDTRLLADAMALMTERRHDYNAPAIRESAVGRFGARAYTNHLAEVYDRLSGISARE